MSQTLTQSLDADDDFDAALANNFSESGLVAPLPAADSNGKKFLAICKRQSLGCSAATQLDSERNDDHSQVLSLAVTNCLSGIFHKQFGFAELADMRREVGMAEFAWGTFLKLLSSALRGHAGCTAQVEVKPTSSSSATPEPRLHLTLRFQLQSAALVTRVDLGVCTDGPGTAPGLDAYLSELHDFIVSAVSAAGGSGANSQSERLSKEFPHLSVQSLTAASISPVSTNSSGMANAARTPDCTPAASPGAKAAAARKRAGSLVDPHARKVRGVGANPFQLSR